MKRSPSSLSTIPRRLLLGIAVIATLTTSARADLNADVRAVLRDPFLAKAQYSVKLVRLSGDHAVTLFEDHAADPMVPASNLKLITTSAAMQRLGADFKFRTVLVQHDGDLYLIGDGDPSFGDAELLKKSGWDVQTVFETWAKGLAPRQLGTIHRLLVDDSVFDMQFVHPNWPADQAQKHYEAEVAGLNLNANLLDIYVTPTARGQIVRYTTDPATHYFTIKNSCVGGSSNAIWLSRQPDSNDLVLRGEAADANDVPVSVTIHDPPLYAGTVLAECLTAAGITVGAVERDRTARTRYLAGEPGWTLLASHETALTTVAARANKDSMNLYAECVCKRLGSAVFGEGSWSNGVAAVGQFLQQIGVPANQFRLDDGCGLSKENVISANLMTTVLAHDYYGPNAKAFMNTMAIAGVDGTMEERFKGTDLRGRVLAKSGFVNGVSCLSGYLHARDGEWYAFSVLFNHVPAGGTSLAKTLEERIVRALDVNSVR
jgi:D-alanyl-D-alanine carboxypeptidase/D-alanyl-D-alanine-endopeptidase (penicillin-binding protein 4)